MQYMSYLANYSLLSCYAYSTVSIINYTICETRVICAQTILKLTSPSITL